MASVNGGPTVLVDQPDSGGGGVVISVPVKVNLNNGANSMTFGSGQTSECRSSRASSDRQAPVTRARRAETRYADYAGDLDKIIVF